MSAACSLKTAALQGSLAGSKRVQGHTSQPRVLGLSMNCSEGGFFQARLSFPKDYPNSPPSCRFISEMWHPNGEAKGVAAVARCPHPCAQFKSQVSCVCFSAFAVYPDGRVCISILHSPGEDPHGYESAAERWSPVQSVRARVL